MAATVQQISNEFSLDAPSALEHTLSLSYEERIEAHQAALELVFELQRAGQKYYEEQS